jgi:diacylglycerol kinase (ATP)
MADLDRKSLQRQGSIRRLWNALGYSLAGLKAAYRYEDAFRQGSCLPVVLIPVALVVPVAATGKRC